MVENKTLWNNVLAQIEIGISKANFSMWFKDTYIIKQEGGVVFLGVPNVFVKDWLLNKYHKDILKNLRGFGEHIRNIEYLVSKEENKSTQKECVSRVNELPLNTDIGWALGLYAAEGCSSLKNNTTSGQVIYTLGYPQEQDMFDKTKSIFSNLGVSTYQCLGRSGFDRTKQSSIQLRVLSTQLAKFVRNNFYNDSNMIAKNKKFCPQIFNAKTEQRVSFLRGYFDGGGCGNWREVARISSRSQHCLIDTVWLSKMSGIEASYSCRSSD